MDLIGNYLVLLDGEVIGYDNHRTFIKAISDHLQIKEIYLSYGPTPDDWSTFKEA